MRTSLVVAAALSLTLAAALSCKTGSDSGLASNRGATYSDGTRITLVGLNDLHGGGVTVNDKGAVGLDADRRGVKIGGPAAIKAYVESVKASNPNGTLVLDAGDSIQGSLVSNNSRGKAVAGLYNFLGVSASAIGNHEFDWGGILATTEEAQPTYDSPFLRVVEQGNYRFLAHNMRFRDQPLETVTSLPGPGGQPYNLTMADGTPKLGSYAIFEREGVKVAVIGAITRTAMDSSSRSSYRDVTIGPIGAGLAQLARDLRTKADVVVLLMHAGFSCGFSKFDYGNDKANTESQCPEVAAGTDEIREILKALETDGGGQRPSELIDAIVAGHVHAPQAHYYSDIPVIQNADKGLGFGRIDLWYDQSAKRITKKKIFPPTLFCHRHFENFAGCDPNAGGTSRPFPAALGKEVAPSYEGRAVDFAAHEEGARIAMAPYGEFLDAATRPITTLSSPLANDRFKESVMARCFVDAIKLETGADLVFAISGGIRDGLPAGEVNAGHVFDVAPFDGASVEVSMTGREVEAYFKAPNKDLNVKSMPIVSEGFLLQVGCNAAGEPVLPKAVFTRDAQTGVFRALDPERTYRVVVSGYLFENPIFDPFRQGRSRLLKSDRDLLTAGFSRADRPTSCTAAPQKVEKCDDSHGDSRWCGLKRTCPGG